MGFICVLKKQGDSFLSSHRIWEANFYLSCENVTIIFIFNENIFKIQFPNIKFNRTAIVITSTSTVKYYPKQGLWWSAFAMTCKLNPLEHNMWQPMLTTLCLIFIFSIQRLPLSQAVVLSFTTPIMASIMARIILHEKLNIAEIGGMIIYLCS